MLTNDISLEDALLDLIDNSVDAIVAKNQVPLDESLILGKAPATRPGQIRIVMTEEHIIVEDDGCGITDEDALTHVFRLGHTTPTGTGTLGVYGIGMKRALFKLGNSFSVSSRSAHSHGFCAFLDDVDTWADNDLDSSEESPDDAWGIPIELGVSELDALGTRIEIRDIRPEIKMRLRDGSLLSHLRAQIGLTYGLLIGRYCLISLNEEAVDAREIPLGTSADLELGLKSILLEDNKVSATIVCGIADRDNQNTETAGWYILCNGRVVVGADKGSTTGWGVDGAAQFVPSFRAFVGIVFFFSNEPLLLPWLTTKRGLNQDSLAYLSVKPIMRSMAKPVLQYLRSLYYDPGDVQTAEQRLLLGSVEHVPIKTIAAKTEHVFSAQRIQRKSPSNVKRVQYDATIEELLDAAKILGDPGASASKIGRASLDFLLQQGD